MHVKNKRKLKLSFFFFCIAGGKKVLGGVDYESSFREGEENREKQAKGERTLKERKGLFHGRGKEMRRSKFMLSSTEIYKIRRLFSIWNS